jgi:L-lactate dehydrogenase complex protein LldG
MSTSSRDLILSRVRAAIGPHRGGSDEVERRYRTHVDEGIDVFLDRLHDYGARTWCIPEAELDAGVRDVLASEGLRRVVTPAGVPDAWVTGFELLRDSPELAPTTLDESDGVISTCALAIAQTGTIVLDGSSGMGRRILSLVPDRLVCVVRAEQIVGSLPQAIAMLDPLRALTFVSGPSATVDIEMVRVAGVHGPRQLAVVVAV